MKNMASIRQIFGSRIERRRSVEAGDRMRSLTSIGVVLSILLIAASAFAADGAMTAGDLQEICVGSSAESKAACRFYILGVVQGMAAGMSIADTKTSNGRPCVPEQSSASALELAVKMKLRQELMVFPDDRKLDASGVVTAIIIHTFPCKKTK